MMRFNARIGALAALLLVVIGISLVTLPVNSTTIRDSNATIVSPLDSAGNVNMTVQRHLSAYWNELAQGNISGKASLRKFGSNPSVVATEEDVQGEGGVLTFPTSAAVASVAYSGNDGDGAPGAQAITMVGLDANWAEQTVAMTFSGASPNTTTETWMRVYRAFVTSAGTYQNAYSTPFSTNEANIDISVGGNLQVRIAVGVGQSTTSHYTVASGKTAYLDRMDITVQAAKPQTVTMWQHPNADDVTTPFSAKRTVHRFTLSEGHSERNFLDMVVFTEKTDIWFSSLGTASGGSVDAEYQLTIVDN